MSKLIKLVGLALAFAAVAVASAEAATGPAMFRSRSPVGIGSNTASVAGNTGPNLGPATYSSGGASVSCADSFLHITLPIPTNTLHATPTFSNCSYVVSGTPVGAATIHHNCEWTATAHHATFNTLSGLTSGITLDICEVTITIPSIRCTIHVTEIDEEPGVTSQNITSTGAADTSASPWGSRITSNLTGLHYITTVHPGGTCSPLSATGSFGYSSSLYLRNVWASL